MRYLLKFLMVIISTQAFAHGPTPIKVNESVVINADPKAIWQIAGKFDGLANWHPDIKSVKATGGEVAGATREITFQNGSVLKEGLDEYDAASFKIGYRMSDPNLEALPISSYTITFTIEPNPSGGSEVKWFGRLYRGDTSNEPPENLNDEAAKNAMTLFLHNGLEALKKKVEKK